MTNHEISQHIKLDERNHVDKPLMDQLSGRYREIIDLDSKQHPDATYRENFTEVVMLPLLREQLKVINPWLEAEQVEEGVNQLIGKVRVTPLLNEPQEAGA
jgi:type I restriction enzyme R subunit